MSSSDASDSASKAPKPKTGAVDSIDLDSPEPCDTVRSEVTAGHLSTVTDASQIKDLYDAAASVDHAGGYIECSSELSDDDPYSRLSVQVVNYATATGGLTAKEQIGAGTVLSTEERRGCTLSTVDTTPAYVVTDCPGVGSVLVAVVLDGPPMGQQQEDARVLARAVVDVL